MSERQTILNSLKTGGQLTAADAARATGLTSMGARGHLERLEQQGLVTYHETVQGRGRPRRYWTLTSAGHQLFPQQYDHLSIELIDNVRELFGQDGLNQVISTRQDKALQKYRRHLDPLSRTEDKLRELARLRTQEGYMAEVIATDSQTWELIEHHCPICAAAKNCQGFCTAELEVFKASLGDELEVTRREHLLADGERCRYQIRPVEKE
ncbi:helix-turn-helix transcriptional regulator [Reinekea blandensis]|uniref:Transcription regulator PadR N-terminal domain-containing protein n=1 Tax=Reinekea blandensis MED297 TaxID=314283 RepID=A4BBX5_9GAMM|nr:metalloregulator ArsR/SmtB family transcription factor [Reinekea blandensis]EAR10460.1 hypothetical protein MED297_01525 [Reinekea sp. MED297] [Reinekea blandensis MED297]